MSLPSLRNHPVIIQAGQSLSAAINVGEREVVGILIPAGWTAANLTFQANHDGESAFLNVHDSAGTELTVTAAASRYIAFTESIRTAFEGIRNLKVRSGTAGTPVNQASSITIQLLVK